MPPPPFISLKHDLLSQPICQQGGGVSPFPGRWIPSLPITCTEITGGDKSGHSPLCLCFWASRSSVWSFPAGALPGHWCPSRTAGGSRAVSPPCPRELLSQKLREHHSTPVTALSPGYRLTPGYRSHLGLLTAEHGSCCLEHRLPPFWRTDVSAEIYMSCEFLLVIRVVNRYLF